jgi:hypothetical protein
LPIAAAVGAVKAYSLEEVDAAQTSFRSVASNPDLLPTRELRIDDAAGASAAGRWGCMEAAAEDAPCPEAAAPAMLEITVRYSPAVEGRYNPDVSIVAMVEAKLTDPSGASHGMRWRYNSAPQPFFARAAKNGAALRRELDTVLDRLASAVAKDLVLDPQATSIEVWEGDLKTGRLGQVRPRSANAPVKEQPGVVRRLHPREAAPYALEHGHKALIAGKRGFWKTCAIASIDGGPPFACGALHPGLALFANVEPGALVFGINCGAVPNEDLSSVEIAETVEAGKTYCIEGESFRSLAVGETC